MMSPCKKVIMLVLPVVLLFAEAKDSPANLETLDDILLLKRWQIVPVASSSPKNHNLSLFLCISLSQRVNRAQTVNKLPVFGFSVTDTHW